MKKDNTRNIVITIFAILFVAALGSLFVQIGMPWFESLQKPSQWIPSFVIPIVWTVVYVLFAIILSIWQKNETLTKKTVALLIVNGVLNIIWCLVFFSLKQLFLGNIVIILNLIFGFLLINDISKSKPLYSWLFGIYPVWLSIATSLNVALWILN